MSKRLFELFLDERSVKQIVYASCCIVTMCEQRHGVVLRVVNLCWDLRGIALPCANECCGSDLISNLCGPFFDDGGPKTSTGHLAAPLESVRSCQSTATITI